MTRQGPEDKLLLFGSVSWGRGIPGIPGTPYAINEVGIQDEYR